MSFYTGTAPNPAIFPPGTPVTTTSYCITGPSAVLIPAEIAGMLVGAAAGGFVGWLLRGILGGVAKWILVLGAKALGVFSPSVGVLIEFLTAMPPDVAAFLVGAIVGAVSATVYLKAAECPKCPTGRRALCFCVCRYGIMPVLPPYPCGGICPGVPAGCP